MVLINFAATDTLNLLCQLPDCKFLTVKTVLTPKLKRGAPQGSPKVLYSQLIIIVTSLNELSSSQRLFDIQLIKLAVKLRCTKEVWEWESSIS